MKNSNFKLSLNYYQVRKFFLNNFVCSCEWGELPTKYNGVSTVTSINNSSTIQHVYAMFNHIYKFSSKTFQSSTIKVQVEKISKNFQSSNQVNLEWKNFKNISNFISVYENQKKFQSSKCKMPGGEIQKILKIFKVQTGSDNSRWLIWKNFKVETQIWLNKNSRKSKSNLSLDWLWYFQSFLENIIEQTIVHSWIYTRIWEENLNSKSNSMCKCTNI